MASKGVKANENGKRTFPDDQHANGKRVRSHVAFGTPWSRVEKVFVPMCADFIHVGHINIIHGASEYGAVIVLLMTDNAMRSYKRAPKMTYEQRESIVRSFKSVVDVLPCTGPESYKAMVHEHHPAFFYHGDDWKLGPQKEARDQVITALKSYGGELIEPATTKDVSSAVFQSMFGAELKQSKQTGVLVQTALNDLKRTYSVIAKETGLGEAVLTRMLQGEEHDQENSDAIIRTLQHFYPLPKKHMVVDPDTSESGVWYMSANETEKSARIFNRVNARKEDLPYYRYMDTATAALSPFKPELIEQLVHVTDNDPMNPQVVMNKGHLLAQLTVFIGPVNFYCTVRGVRQCKVMNTGDSCLITPYVPHSFTTRDPTRFAAIAAVTFSGQVRDVLSDLVQHDIRRIMHYAGNSREPSTVLARRIERFAELRGFSIGQLREKLVADHKLQAATVDDTIAGKPDTATIKAISTILDCDEKEFHVNTLLADEEVTYQTAPAEPPKGSAMYAFASSRHMPDCGGYEWYLDGSETLTSQFFNYLYNHGDTPVKMCWAAGKTATLAKGDSAMIKPFVPVSYETETGKPARLVVCKVAGCVNNAVMQECSLFACEGLERMTKEDSCWW